VVRFEPPSGASLTSSGLYTEDAYDWTWPLEDALRLTVTATGLDLANLRARAAQLMSRMGGAAAFGPDAVARQLQRLGRLSLHCTYRKLIVSAAFQAMRELIGELVAADAINPRLVPFILHHAAAYSSNISTLPPEPRPHGVPVAQMVDIYRHSDSTEWRANVEQDVVQPTMTGHVVLAATARHHLRHFRDEWTVEQYFGADTGEAGDDLSRQLRRLPQIIVADGIYPDYDDLAPAALVRPDFDISGSVDPYTVTLCPRVAARLGWRPDPRHVFTYLDTTERVVVRTLYWRDGGVRCQSADAAVFRYGHVLIVREDRADDLRPYLATAQASRAWRVTQTSEKDTRLVTSGSRVEGPPGSAQPRTRL
jgi:hypothetical protein